VNKLAILLSLSTGLLFSVIQPSYASADQVRKDLAEKVVRDKMAAKIRANQNMLNQNKLHRHVR
jgi:hypothetical protein